METARFQKKNIFYSDQGKGKPIVLLHGFTESSKIWTGFATALAKRYRVITIDLPGHGKSECVTGVHTMELLAEVVDAVLKKLRINKCLMIGHSMGGYVTLAFAAKYASKLKGFGLFHSHCFPDTEAEKKLRNRTIRLVEQDKFGFIAQFIPSLFPVEVHEKFAKEIRKLVQRAAKMEPVAVVAALEGMKVRSDQSALLQSTRLPVLFILGQKDVRAPQSRLWEMVSLPPAADVLLLRDCGHMGYIEAPEKTLAAIEAFARRVW